MAAFQRFPQTGSAVMLGDYARAMNLQYDIMAEALGVTVGGSIGEDKGNRPPVGFMCFHYSSGSNSEWQVTTASP